MSEYINVSLDAPALNKQTATPSKLDSIFASQSLMTGEPLYRTIKAKITDALHKGVWQSGAAIASEAELSRYFKVSIGTVRRAIDDLVNENILVRHQGRGTFVASHESEQYFYAFFRILRHNGQRSIPQVTLLNFVKTKANIETAQRLQIDYRAPIFSFRNLLTLQGQPVMIDDIVVPAQSFARLTEIMLRSRKTTIYNFYQKNFGISIVRTTEKIRAVTADPTLARVLRVRTASALLKISRTAYTFRDHPIELRDSYVNSAHHEYDTESIFGRQFLR